MINLCIDARMAFFSGIGTCIRELVSRFSQSRFRMVLLVDRLDQSWCKGLEQIFFSAPIYSLQEQAAFPLKIPKCDLFWSPHYNIPLLPIRAKRRIATIHDACHLALGQYLSAPQRAYARIVMSRALYRSDRVITDSIFSKNELHRYLGRKEIEVIAAGVDPNAFRRREDPALRLKYQLPQKYMLFVGNLKPHKNLEGLVRAFERVSLPGWKLVFAGKGNPMKDVVSLGPVLQEELPPLYSMAEAFIFPSFYEGFGLPPLEAMCCGCPTLVSNAASIPEVCGDASLYFHPGKQEEIAQAIERVATDAELRNHLIQKGFEQVKQFDWNRSAEKYLSIFEEAHRA